MEIYISISSIKEEEEKSINLGKAQLLMDISHTQNSLIGIKILISTPLSEEAINALRKTAKETSEIKISSDWKKRNTNPQEQDEVIEELEEGQKLKKEKEWQEGGKDYENEVPDKDNWRKRDSISIPKHDFSYYKPW
jgi:guanyl-specific ribonuclease Sa